MAHQPQTNDDSQARTLHPDFAAESAHLDETVKLIDQRIADLSRLQLTRKDWTKEAARRMRLAALTRMENARKEPYFGRVDFAPADRPAAETYRIGRAGGPGITDWRAPVATLFYSRGGTSYEAPGGTVAGRVGLRRHYRIEQGKLLELFDARVADGILDSLASAGDAPAAGSLGAAPEARADVAGAADAAGAAYAADAAVDAFLVRQLGREAGRRMRDIVSTIQSEQDQVLRAPLYQVVLLQGVAGSGKTAVALHRVAYLLYTYADRIRAEDILVLAPSRLLLEYVERLLPSSLGIDGVVQKTIREWEVELLGLNHNARFAAAAPRCVAEFVRSPAAKETLAAWAAERATDRAAARRSAGGPRGKGPDGGGQAAGRLGFAAWADFLASPAGARRVLGQGAAHVLDDWAASVRSGRFAPEDLSAMVFLAERLGRFSEGRRYDHIVVDEAEDLDPLLCDVLARRCKHPSLTLVGDLAQSLGPVAAASWREVTGDAFRENQTVLHSFRTNYRSSRQIVEFSRAILGRAGAHTELPEAVPRDAAPVGVTHLETAAQARQHLVDSAAALAARHGSVLVVTADQAGAREALGSLAYLGFAAAGGAGDPGDGRQMKVVAPLRAVRGMEYDAVVLYDAGHADYREKGAGARRLYTAATRALHELQVIWWGDASPYLPA